MALNGPRGGGLFVVIESADALGVVRQSQPISQGKSVLIVPDKTIDCCSENSANDRGYPEQPKLSQCPTSNEKCNTRTPRRVY